MEMNAEKSVLELIFGDRQIIIVRIVIGLVLLVMQVDRMIVSAV
jgi:hypothetical protein